MISAKEARLATTNNFVSSLTGKQLALHNQIKDYIKQAIDEGFYYINKNGKDFSENWIDEHRNASVSKLIPYYEQLGYSVHVNFNSGSENLIIRW